MKRVFLGSFITIISVSAILAGIYYYQKLKIERFSVMDAIPENAVFILQSKNIQDSFQKLVKCKSWSQLETNKSFQHLENELVYADSLVSSNKEFQDLLKNEPVTISLHRNGGQNYDFLFVFSTQDLNPETTVNRIVNAILKDKIPIAKRLFENITIIEIPVKINGSSTTLSYALSNGIVALSFSGSLLESCLKNIKKPGGKTKNNAFRKVMYAAGSNVDGNLYINYKHLPNFLSRYFKQEYSAAINDVADFAKWTEFDLKIKNNGISLNGLSVTDSSSTYMDCFIGQQPQHMNISRVLPFTTACFMYWGVSNFKSYYTAYKKYISRAAYNSKRYKDYVLRNALLKRLGAKDNIDVEERMQNWIGSEFALVVLQNSDSLGNDNQVAVFQAKDIASAERDLSALQSASGGDTLGTYNGCNMGMINAHDLLSRLLGNAFASFHNTYYAFLGNYVVFGNSINTLKYFINENVAQHVLNREEGFQNFMLNFSNRSNFGLYGDFQKGLPVLKSFLTDSVGRILEKNASDFGKFSGIGLQFIADEQIGGFFSNLFLSNSFKRVTSTEVSELWKLELDDAISATPRFVKNGHTGETEVIVQDESNKLYLINKSGEILWSRQLPGKIMGKIYQIDGFKNNHWQFVFNTRQHLYLIDHDGNNVEKFPVKFSSPASNAIAVFDYDNTRDYRIYLSHENGQVDVFQANGKPVGGWKFTAPIWPMRVPVEYCAVGAKEYLLLSDSKGITYILDRKGEKQAIADKPIYRSMNNHWIMDVADQPYFVTTDTAGNIFNLYLSGVTEAEHIAKFKSDHYFDFRDVNGDKLKDYIFMNKNSLFVCNQDTTKIFDYTFPDNTGKSLSLCAFQMDEHPVMAVTSVINNKIYLLNHDGSLKKGFPVPGSTMVEEAQVSLNGKDRPGTYMIAGSKDKNLYFYQLH